MQHFNGVVWSTPLGLPRPCGICIHQHSTSGIRKKKKNWNKKVTLHILTHGAMRGCGLTSLVVCIHDKNHDIRERNVTIRNEIWTTNIRSLRFQDIRECVTLWRLILQSLGCNLDTIWKHGWVAICQKWTVTTLQPKLWRRGTFMVILN